MRSGGHDAAMARISTMVPSPSRRPTRSSRTSCSRPTRTSRTSCGSPDTSATAGLDLDRDPARLATGGGRRGRPGLWPCSGPHQEEDGPLCIAVSGEQYEGCQGPRRQGSGHRSAGLHEVNAPSTRRRHPAVRPVAPGCTGGRTERALGREARSREAIEQLPYHAAMMIAIRDDMHDEDGTSDMRQGWPAKPAPAGWGTVWLADNSVSAVRHIGCA